MVGARWICGDRRIPTIPERIGACVVTTRKVGFWNVASRRSQRNRRLSTPADLAILAWWLRIPAYRPPIPRISPGSSVYGTARDGSMHSTFLGKERRAGQLSIANVSSPRLSRNSSPNLELPCRSRSWLHEVIPRRVGAETGGVAGLYVPYVAVCGHQGSRRHRKRGDITHCVVVVHQYPAGHILHIESVAGRSGHGAPTERWNQSGQGRSGASTCARRDRRRRGRSGPLFHEVILRRVGAETGGVAGLYVPYVAVCGHQGSRRHRKRGDITHCVVVVHQYPAGHILHIESVAGRSGHGAPTERWNQSGQGRSGASTCARRDRRRRRGNRRQVHREI